MNDRQPTQSLVSNGFVCLLAEGRGSRTIVALHGSGADEGTMVPLARSVDPNATIISVRGRFDQNGERRWFRKITPTSFEQDSIHAESAAFARFIAAMSAQRRLDPGHILFVGYSNGGNLVHATMLLHPGLIRHAALLRCMPVLSRAPMTDLSGSHMLIVPGAKDLTYAPYAPRLAALLRRRGAVVMHRSVPTDHMIGDADVRIVRRWLGA